MMQIIIRYIRYCKLQYPHIPTSETKVLESSLMSGWFDLKCKRFQTQKSAPKTRDDSGCGCWSLSVKPLSSQSWLKGSEGKFCIVGFNDQYILDDFPSKFYLNHRKSILDKSSVIDDFYIWFISSNPPNWLRQFPSHVWFSYLSTIQESLTVTNRAVQLLVEKSGLADVSLREALMLVWGRRFSCDVATGMIPLGDLLLGSPERLMGMGENMMKDLERFERYRISIKIPIVSSFL